MAWESYKAPCVYSQFRDKLYFRKLEKIKFTLRGFKDQFWQNWQDLLGCFWSLWMVLTPPLITGSIFGQQGFWWCSWGLLDTSWLVCLTVMQTLLLIFTVKVIFDLGIVIVYVWWCDPTTLKHRLSIDTYGEIRDEVDEDGVCSTCQDRSEIISCVESFVSICFIHMSFTNKNTVTRCMYVTWGCMWEDVQTLS